MSDDKPTDAEGPDPQVSFKVKTSSDALHNITIAESKTVLDLKNVLAGDEYEKIPADRQRLIYSGRVMKDADLLSSYKIKTGNTIHMVKNAQSNAAQRPATTATPGARSSAAAGVPTNMAAGTANNPLAGLTGARYAGHMGLPSMNMFGADGGMGAPPSEDQLATMLDDPNMQQMMNEAFNNPDIVNMIIQNTPQLRNNPEARALISSPEFRSMMTNPAAIRQAAQMRRMMQGGGAPAFPAPGATDNTTGTGDANAAPVNPFAAMGLGGGQAGAGSNPFQYNNPFASLFPQAGQTPAQTPPTAGSTGQGTPNQSNTPANDRGNPFASLLAGGGGNPPNPFGAGMPPMTPEAINQAMQFLQQSGGAGAFGNLFGGAGAGAAAPPAAPADTRPPEEVYQDQLRQLNDMGFFDFDQNVAALRRSGGSVQGAIEQLLS